MSNPVVEALVTRLQTLWDARPPGPHTHTQLPRLEVSEQLKIPTGAAAGKVFTSDASGVGSWQDAPAGGGGGTNPAIAFGAVDGAVPATASDKATALGHSSTADASGTAIGALAQATTAGVSIGADSQALVSHSLAVGTAAKARTSVAVAIGPSADVSGAYSTAISYGAKATGMAGVAIGPVSEAGDFSVAIGYAVKANHKGSIAMGASSTETNAIAATTADNQIMLGTEHHTVEVPGRVKIPTYGAVGKVLTSDADGVGSWESPGVAVDLHPANYESTAPQASNGGIAGGSNAKAHAFGSIAIGIDASTGSNAHATAIGEGTWSDEHGVALGYQARANDSGVAIGSGVYAEFSGSVVLGVAKIYDEGADTWTRESAQDTRANQIVLGTSAHTAVVRGRLVLCSPNGSTFALNVSDSGVVSTEPVDISPVLT